MIYSADEQRAIDHWRANRSRKKRKAPLNPAARIMLCLGAFAGVMLLADWLAR